MTIEEDNNSKIIHLKKSDRVEETGLIKDAIYDINTNNIRISLNHYTNSDIIFTIDKKSGKTIINFFWKKQSYTESMISKIQ